MPREVLLIDNITGRGHALCDLFLRGSTEIVHYGPGHPGIGDDRVLAVPTVSLSDPCTAIAFCAEREVDFVFVSWIDSLAAGYADALRAAGLRVIGPDQRAAQLEASKAAGKVFCSEHGVPMPRWHIATDVDEALAIIGRHPVVVKEDGLTTVSDGVVVCHTPADSRAAVLRAKERMGASFRVVIEEFLAGRDVSVTAFVSGVDYLLLPPALDYKRTEAGDRGTNCDGMGTLAPHPDEQDLTEQMHEVVGTVVKGMAADGMHYSGFLYVGCMLVEGRLVVLEINARLGDSEAQALLPGMRGDFHQLCLGIGGLEHDGRTRCCVAATQGHVPGSDPLLHPGWPHGPFLAGQPVRGLESITGAQVFFGGATRHPDGQVTSRLGRVLFVVGTGADRHEAADNAYAELSKVDFPGMRYRPDIGRLI